MDSELCETPRFNYGVKKERKKTPIRTEYKKIEYFDYFQKKDHQHKHPRSVSNNHFLQKKLKYKTNLMDKIIIFEFLFKKFNLRNDFDQEHADIFLEEKEQIFKGYPTTDEISD